ncbi:uncharacterized protein K460DRAFT_403564 [Cucurbitaria berberidis CBS 394.84]|uniref:Uncharacterized protein n=1 Tax=Cucurbitaria berberidis CBS 394.84 TaxID=1168544 RepID=A0A9P4LBE0_9PLEO|nr:uncharacterized protein K460DRAFT_403564 [Cucurbitaria berberidis CBS 394.84]KAF1848272.1 hypothetical protein K460DRAFT_403564 [Cucurbitaria berberidis CBS 394.84]
MPGSSLLHSARSYLHKPSFLDSSPPRYPALPTIREPERAAGLSQRYPVQRESILIERRHEHLSTKAKRHVRFDVSTKTRNRHTRKHEDYYDGPPGPESHTSNSPRTVLQAPPRPRPSNLRPQPQPLPDTPEPTQPTIYIITYSTDRTPNSKAFKSLLETHLPHRDPPIPHLYTIDASSMLVPPKHLCAVYSGLSPVIQSHVLHDPRARKAIRNGMRDLLEFGKVERQKGSVGQQRRGGGGGERGMMEVAMSVCCHAGTHRSVAIADLIALEVRNEVGRLEAPEGVRVVVRHVHRVRGKMDPF